MRRNYLYVELHITGFRPKYSSIMRLFSGNLISAREFQKQGPSIQAEFVWCTDGSKPRKESMLEYLDPIRKITISLSLAEYASHTRLCKVNIKLASTRQNQPSSSRSNSLSRTQIKIDGRLPRRPDKAKQIKLSNLSPGTSP